MSRIMFVGDIHINDTAPSSRKDTYGKTVLDKIMSLDSIAKANEVDLIVYEGDIFNTAALSLSFLVKCLQAFQSISVPQYFIIGNHDITYERLENFYKSPLNLIAMTGTLKHLDYTNPLVFEDDNVYLFGYDYGVEIQPVQKYENATTICVAHTYYDNELYGKTSTMLSKEDAVRLGYDIYVLGHDHSIYDPVVTDSYRLYRHGSLLRGTSSKANLERDVFVGIFDTSDKSWNLVSVPHLPAKEVFRDKIVIEKTSPKQIEYNLDSIIENLDALVSQTDAYDVMDSLKLPDNIVKFITYYFESHGLYRKVDKVE